MGVGEADQTLGPGKDCAEWGRWRLLAWLSPGQPVGEKEVLLDVIDQ